MEGYLELHRNPTIRLEEPALDAPFKTLPPLYQKWGTLQVVSILLSSGLASGFPLQTQHLAALDSEGVFVHFLLNGDSVLALVQPATGTALRLIPERTYCSTGSPRSLSFPQRPDVAIEIIPVDAPLFVVLFDPTYKLSNDGIEAAAVPLKEDIDKMHTYRDAIRDNQGGHVVCSAHTLYPWQTFLYGAEIGAIETDQLVLDLMKTHNADLLNPKIS